MKKKDYTVTIIVVVGLFVLTMMLLVVVTPPQRLQQRPIVKKINQIVSTAPVAYSGRAHIEAIDQNATDKVMLLSVAFKEPGFVVIHKDEKGKAGGIIGVSPLIQPGLYSDRTVALTENVAPGEMLIAMLHIDNGDGVFSAETDGPMKGDKMMMGGSGMVEFMAI